MSGIWKLRSRDVERPRWSSSPAVLQHYDLRARRAIHNLDDVALVPCLGKPGSFEGRFLLVAEGSGHGVVQDVEAFILAHGAKMEDAPTKWHRRTIQWGPGVWCRNLPLTNCAAVRACVRRKIPRAVVR